jgi:cobalt/nickel transport system permease protein
MIEDLFFIEKQAYRESSVHHLDARVKILITLTAIIAIVAFPYTSLVFFVFIAFYLFFLTLWGISHLPWRFYLQRVIAILPFGGFLIVFQIFYKNRYFTEFHAIAELPLGIVIYQESALFAVILFAKFLVCISFVILLSSTTRMQDILEGARRLGFPAEFTLIVGMMVRYVFVLGYVIRKVQNALETRCFDPFNHQLSYRYRIRQLGYTIGTIFLRSYEQGERTYTAMLCRGYGRDAHIFIRKKPLTIRDRTYLAGSMAFLIAVPVGIYLSAIL